MSGSHESIPGPRVRGTSHLFQVLLVLYKLPFHVNMCSKDKRKIKINVAQVYCKKIKGAPIP